MTQDTEAITRLFTRRIGRLERRLRDRDGKCRATLWRLTEMYRDLQCYDDVQRCLEKILEIAPDDGERIGCLLQLGGNMEKLDDFDAAIGYYERCCRMDPQEAFPRYFAHNNLGYCLNTVGRHEEAEPHLQEAVRIDWQRHNAHKNLGLSCQARGRLREAAEAFITATELQPKDPRAFRHLRQLLNDHPEMLEQTPHLEEQARRCEKLVRRSRVHAIRGLPSATDTEDADSQS